MWILQVMFHWEETDLPVPSLEDFFSNRMDHTACLLSTILFQYVLQRHKLQTFSYTLELSLHNYYASVPMLVPKHDTIIAYSCLTVKAAIFKKANRNNCSLKSIGKSLSFESIFAVASPTLYYRFEPKFYVNFRQSEVFLNCNIHHTS